MSEDALSKRYQVITEGESSIKGYVVLPGAARMPHGEDTLPVTLDYKNENIIGAANGFERSKVTDGYCWVSFNVRLKESANLTHDDLNKLKAGVYLSDVFSYDPKLRGGGEWYITDGIIREISFYDPCPPAIRVTGSL